MIQVLGRRKRVGQVGRLGAYLAAGAGAGVVGSTAEAGVVTIDVSGFNGINAGVNPGSYRFLTLTPAPGFLFASNAYLGYTGLNGNQGLLVATGGSPATPTKLAAGMTVDATLSFSGSVNDAVFRYGGSVSPDFGAGSYMAFKDSQGRYGYLEVNWTAATNTYRILSGAYESVGGVGIVIPNSTPAVPEPSTLGLMALGAAGLLAARARNAPAEAPAESTSA